MRAETSLRPSLRARRRRWAAERYEARVRCAGAYATRRRVWWRRRGVVGAAPRVSASIPNGTSGPFSRSFACPRMPTDALALSAQVLAGFRNTLRDNRFVSAAVKVS